MKWYESLARHALFLGCIVAGVGFFAAQVFPRSKSPRPMHLARSAEQATDLQHSIDGLNALAQAQWDQLGLQPAPLAPLSTQARRLSLALAGTIPALEELRWLERYQEQNGEAPEQWWLDNLFRNPKDHRASDYLAERWARALVGTHQDPFILFRRRRFVSWLAEQIQADRPYDQLVRELITAQGLWTDKPATNFHTATIVAGNDQNHPDPLRVAGTVSRVFLGVRLDCAQCHDHPFEKWKQDDFRGLVAFFGQSRNSITGIWDDANYKFELEDLTTGAKLNVPPTVPFQSELLPADENRPRRARLAAWVIDPKNRSLSRATVNRVWALLFGRPLVEPLDDLGTSGADDPLLNYLADDFVQHGFKLQRLIRVIAGSELFQRDSAAPFEVTAEHEQSWAVFPVTRLRPEQVVGGLLQAASLPTINGDSHILVRLARFGSEEQFVERYGDAGEEELFDRGGTIPQRLLMLNGGLVEEKTKANIMNAAQQISMFVADDKVCIDTLYKTVLTRLPTPAESAHFASQLHELKGDARHQQLGEAAWVLVNSTEFSWNH